MRLPGRIAAAIEVLADMEARKRPASEALKGWALDHRFAGAGDRAAIGNLVYDALRKRASHAFRMGEDTPRAWSSGWPPSSWVSRPAARPNRRAGLGVTRARSSSREPPTRAHSTRCG